MQVRWRCLAHQLLVLWTLLSVSGAAWSVSSPDRPNIVVILADDLGYGDLGSYGATKIRTPHMDRLAREGLRFLDAHSPHSVCTPTRYGLLTGRYAWRAWSSSGTVWADDPLLIETTRLTLPKLLQSAGYETAIIGKWHLGFGARGTPGWDDLKGPDYNGELKPGPLEVGFDYFFGVPHVGQQPHVFIENHRVVGLRPDDPIRIVLDRKWQQSKVSHLERLGTPNHQFTGGAAAQYRHEDLAVTLTERAVSWIEKQGYEPFFLYFSHRNPHAPIAPHSRFKGSSEAGHYGDFVQELDWSVGEVLQALERRGVSRRTIVILTSDNGGVVDYLPSKFAEVHGHRVNAPLFGQKTEVYEGGHRVPFILRWPGVVKQGVTSDALVALTDVLATTAQLLRVRLPQDAGEDSFSFLPVLEGREARGPVRQNLVMDSYSGRFAIREGPWKLILARDGGGYYSLTPDASSAAKAPGQLYDLSRDPRETTNLYDAHRDVVARLTWKLKEIQYGGRSRDAD